MHCNTKRRMVQWAQGRLHILVLFSLLVLAVAGHVPEGAGGWVACPPQVVMAPEGRRRRPGKGLWGGGVHPGAVCRQYLSRSWPIPLLRSLLLGGLWHLSGQRGPAWVSLLPWGQWLWQGSGLWWPWLHHQPEWRAADWLLRHAYLLVVAALAGLGVGARLRGEPWAPPSPCRGARRCLSLGRARWGEERASG